MLEALVPWAERLVRVIEDAPQPQTTPRTTHATHSTTHKSKQNTLQHQKLTDDLLAGVTHHHTPHTDNSTLTTQGTHDAAHDPAQLQADFEQLLKQRTLLRAQLEVERERRERAEAELVAIGAQWLGTDTQEQLRKRAELSRRRQIDAETERVTRACEARIARAEAEKALLLRRLDADAPSETELQGLLHQAMREELGSARRQAHDAAGAQLGAALDRASRLERSLVSAEARHAQDVAMLRASLRKAESLVQEQWETGFAAGLRRAAETLGHVPVTTSGAPEPTSASANVVTGDAVEGETEGECESECETKGETEGSPRVKVCAPVSCASAEDGAPPSSGSSECASSEGERCEEEERGGSIVSRE